MKAMWKKMKKEPDKWIYRILLAAFTASMVPILYLSRYIVPGCDDYTYGVATHGAWLATHSLWEVLKAAFQTTVDYWFHWQGTYSSIFLMTLSPGILHERWYFLTTLIMTGMLGVSIAVLFHVVLKNYAGAASRQLRGICAIVVLFLSFQTMVSPADGLFWYNGALHYVFMESVLFFQAGALLTFCRAKTKKGKTGWLLLSVLLSFVLGGANLLTALQSVILTVLLFLYLLYQNRRAQRRLNALEGAALRQKGGNAEKAEGRRYLADAERAANRQRLWVLLPLLVNLAGFALNVAAPGNSVRETTAEGMGAVQAILLSFYWAAVFVTEWLTPLALAGFLLLCPVVWRMVRQSEARFFRPLIAAVLSFCVFAAMFTPTLYASSSEGPDRCKNVMRVVLYVLLFFNLVNTFGYFANRKKSGMVYDIQNRIAGSYLPFVTVCAFIMGGIFLLAADKNTFTSVSAVRSIVNGEAADYYEQNCERLAVYNDGDVLDVTVKYLTAKPHLLFKADVGNEGSQDYWIAISIRDYYRKNSVRVE